MADIIQIQESEYDAILRQAVAVIDRTRVIVATTVCSAIGKIRDLINREPPINTRFLRGSYIQ